MRWRKGIRISDGLENVLELNERGWGGIGKSGRGKYIGFRENSLLFFTKKNLVFLLQNKNSHIKYNKEVIGFHILFFLLLVVESWY